MHEEHESSTSGVTEANFLRATVLVLICAVDLLGAFDVMESYLLVLGGMSSTFWVFDAI